MKRVLLIIGGTGTGKDFVTKYIHDEEVISKIIVSYATRKIGKGEQQGVQHLFVTKETAQKILWNKDTFAYTKIGENEYFTMPDQFEHTRLNLYIVDPNGYMDSYMYAEDHPEEFEVQAIYLKVPKWIQLKRLKKRNRDDHETIEERLSSEKDMFERFDKMINHLNKTTECPIYRFRNYGPFWKYRMNKLLKKIKKKYKSKQIVMPESMYVQIIEDQIKK